MRIGFDARLCSETGIGRYIRNLLTELEHLDSENEYFVFMRSQDLERLQFVSSKWNKVVLDYPWHSIKEQFFVPRILDSYKLDLMHFPYFNVPWFYSGRFVLTIHDLIIDHFQTGKATRLPLFLYYLKRTGYRFVLSNAVRKAEAIFTVSKSTKHEVIAHYNSDPDKIIVTYDALDKQFHNICKNKKPQNYIGDKYALYVGNAYPHKNLEKLIEAFEDKNLARTLKLVLVGDDAYFYRKLKNDVQKKDMTDRIIFFGKADNEELLGLYHHAQCLISCSQMEGFGLPVLEALRCGCLPVISDIDVYRELWDGMLPVFDPESVGSIRSSVKSLLKMNKNEYRKRVDKAYKNSGRFSWRKAAKSTYRVYEKIKERIDI